MAFRVAHYAPWLFYWWMTQKWFPALSIFSGNTSIFCPQDMETLKKLSESITNDQVSSLSTSINIHAHVCLVCLHFSSIDAIKPLLDLICFPDTGYDSPTRYTRVSSSRHNDRLC